MKSSRLEPLAEQANLILVVGPSGVGKDSLMNAARQAFATHPRLAFPPRHITRKADAGGEEHIAVSEATFASNEAAGLYCLSWGAHGLFYAIPAAVLDLVRSGTSVVVNVSRRILPQAEKLGVPVAVLHITARPETLAKRLAARGRESAEDIAKRLAREAPITLTATPVVEVANDADLAAGERTFIAAVSRFIPAAHGGRE